MRKTVVVGISSSIAAFKILGLIRILRKKDYEVYVIMTEHAKEMINPEEFAKTSGHKVYIKLFESGFDYKNILRKRNVEHIELAKKADLLLIAPATANIIGKIAHGIADDFLTTAILASTAPILLCPSMNTNMWNNPAVRDNLTILRKRNIHIITPESGSLACGTDGVGRLPEGAKIVSEIEKILKRKDKLKGKKIIVTAGGTTESIDAVRVITNRSSGKMGIALAEESFLQGADVLLLRSKSSVVSGYNIQEEIFETGGELAALMQKYVNNYDCLFHTAAVSDFVIERKIDKKIDSSKDFSLKLKSAPKILHKIKSWNPKIKLIGFKAVYKLTEEQIIEAGRKKLQMSNSDYIIVNDVGKVGIGFGADDNEVYIISPGGLVRKIGKAHKKDIAGQIIEYIFG